MHFFIIWKALCQKKAIIVLRLFRFFFLFFIFFVPAGLLTRATAGHPSPEEHGASPLRRRQDSHDIKTRLLERNEHHVQVSPSLPPSSLPPTAICISVHMADCVCSEYVTHAQHGSVRVRVCLSIPSLRHQPRAVFLFSDGREGETQTQPLRIPLPLNPDRWTQVAPRVTSALIGAASSSGNSSVCLCLSV